MQEQNEQEETAGCRFKAWPGMHITMSGNLDILALKNNDVNKMPAWQNLTKFQLESFVFKSRPDGVRIINLGGTCHYGTPP